MIGKRKTPPKPVYGKPMWEPEPKTVIQHERVNLFKGVEVPLVYLRKSPPINLGQIILHEVYNLHPFYTSEEREAHRIWESIVKTTAINCSQCHRGLGSIEIPYDVKVDITLVCPVCKSKMGYRCDPEVIKLKENK